jgi:hypothetical protein
MRINDCLQHLFEIFTRITNPTNVFDGGFFPRLDCYDMSLLFGFLAWYSYRPLWIVYLIFGGNYLDLLHLEERFVFWDFFLFNSSFYSLTCIEFLSIWFYWSFFGFFFFTKNGYGDHPTQMRMEFRDWLHLGATPYIISLII